MWVLALFVIIVIAFGCHWYITRSYSRVPLIIWTYWEDPESLSPDKRLSDAAKAAMATWRQWNPSYEIIVLTKANYSGYVTLPEEIRDSRALLPDHLAAILKLAVIAERGGVWLHPTTRLTRPLESWMFPRYAEVSYLAKDHGPPRSAFLAANRGSEFVRAWRDELYSVAAYSCVEEYLVAHEKAFPFTDIKDPFGELDRVAALTVLTPRSDGLTVLDWKDHIIVSDATI